MQNTLRGTGRRTLKYAIATIIILSPAAFALDGGGCTDSPENPSAVLGALGGVAAALPWMRGQLGLLRERYSRRSPS